jgi:hypothetical protein
MEDQVMRKTMPANVIVKDAATGEVEAVFATLNVIDRDGDVILPGAIPEGAPVAVSSSHKAWEGALAVGAGTIHEIGDELVSKIQYFMDTDHGRNAFFTVKGLAEHGLGEWSWSLEDVSATRGTWKTDSGSKPANIITKVGKVAEVSDVFRGAGINTRTLAVKGQKQLSSDIAEQLRGLARTRFGDDEHYVYVEDWDVDAEFVIVYISADDEPTRLVQVSYSRDGDTVTLGDDEVEVEQTVRYAPKSGVKFSEQLVSVVADVKALVDRAEEIVVLRAAKGKSISDDARTGLDELAELLDRVKTLTASPAPDTTDDEAVAEFLRFVAISQGVHT